MFIIQNYRDAGASTSDNDLDSIDISSIEQAWIYFLFCVVAVPLGLVLVMNKLDEIKNEKRDLKWISPKKDGDYREYYNNEQLEREGSWKNGLQSGTWRGYYKNGQSRSLMEFHEGKKNGVCKMWHEDGHLWYEKTFLNDIEIKVINVDDITIIDDKAYYKKDMSIVNATIVSYYDDGQLEYEVTALNGMEHGISKYYYEHGGLEEEIKYENGQANGISKFYYENGGLEEEVEYENGKRHGISKFYNKEGGLEEEVKYENDAAINNINSY